MKTDNFDKLGKEDNILDRIEQAERRARSTTRKNVRSARLSNLANELGELEYRVVDADGNLRMVMSAYDLFDELGVHAHLAGLDTNAVVQFYLSADDGKAYFAGGDAVISSDGISLLAEEYPASPFLNWKLATGETVAYMSGATIAAASVSGLFFSAKAKNSSYDGIIDMGVEDHNGVLQSYLELKKSEAQFILATGAPAALGAAGLTIRSNITTTNDLNNVLYLDTYTSGTPANLLGSAIAYRAENSTPAMKQQGFTGFEWIDKTAGSEDADFLVGVMKAGSLTTGMRVSGTGVTLPFGLDVTNGHVRSFSALPLNDDAATSFTPTKTVGICLVFCGGDNTAYALFHYSTTPAVTTFIVGSNTNSTTGALTGTTGVDTKFTVSCHTDGKLYFENRRGAARNVFVLLI